MQIYFIPFTFFINKQRINRRVINISCTVVFFMVAVEYFLPFAFSGSINFPIMPDNRCKVQNYKQFFIRILPLSPVNYNTFLPMVQVYPFKSILLELSFI